jgi:hypothetical protein
MRRQGKVVVCGAVGDPRFLHTCRVRPRSLGGTSRGRRT